MPARIERTLKYAQLDGETSRIGQEEILSFREPVAILGDPGLGKTVLAQWLGEKRGMKYVRAGTFVRAADPANLDAEDERIIVDGIDEIASAAPGGAVDAVLTQLSVIGNPLFILSCRAAEWLGATDRTKIEDDYGAAPVMLHLQPFTKDDARAFLAEEFPEIDSTDVLAHLARFGIQALYENPLTLRMLGEVTRDDGRLPKTRAELFDRACRVMLKEENPRHHQGSHVHRSEEDLLLAAGAICAAQLLCGYIGVFTGPKMETPEGYLNAVDVADLPFGDAVNDALRVRLLPSEIQDRFTHVHRAIAEFLGAKWLARCFEAGVSEKRIFALFRQGEGVPTSLRGLHAWLAHFNEILAHRCIEADPYAVLRYGDAETLCLDQARLLLTALKKLSEADPFFRSEDWGRHPVSGLLRNELRDDIRAIIEPIDQYVQLTVLLLEAMVGSNLAEALGDTLESIAFDGRRYVDERSAAASALFAASVDRNPVAVIDRLLSMNDPDSARLAFETLGRLGLFGVLGGTSIDIVLAYLGLPAKMRPREHRYIPDNLFKGLDTEGLALWLDSLVETARPMMEKADFQAKWYVTRLVRRLAVTILEADPEIRPERIWNWINWLDRNRAHTDDANKRLAAVFRENRKLRAALLEHVLLTPCAENTCMAGHRLVDTGLGLYPKPEDIVGLLKSLRARTEDEIDHNTWRGLLRHGRTAEGLPAAVRTAAVEAACGDPELLSVVDEMSERPDADWEAGQDVRDGKRKARRDAVCRVHRQTVAERSEDVVAGDVHLLELPACIYLNRPVALDAHFHFEAATPQERLCDFLGDELGAQVISGFVAVLDRDDLPSASGIVEARCENEIFRAEAPMICGVMEMIRRGIGLDGVERDTLAAAYMAWQRGPESESSEPSDIALAMEKVLFLRDSDWEAFFRMSIEPQLDRNRNYPSDLMRLTYEPCFSGLAGRLSVEWLRRYPGLNLHVQTELLVCALKNAPHKAVRELVIEVRKRSHTDVAIKLLWLSADYIVDLQGCRPTLAITAADHPQFIWNLRDRIVSNCGQRFDRFSLDQLEFIVESFGGHWSNVGRPTGITTGDCNPWDASEFIREIIHAIASRPQSEASVVLQNLIADHAPTYTDTMKHALALQLKGRRDRDYSAPTIGELRSAVTDGLPESIDQMRAYFSDCIEILQKRIRGSNTNMWEAYWVDNRPQTELFCRNRMIEHISNQLPPSIRFEPEMHMPRQKRADIAAIGNSICLPVEIKGQWHRDVWNAACDQLDANYARDWQADGRGAYIVLWFGNVAKKRLKPHPDGLKRPETPDALRQMLVDRLPEERRFFIDVFVLDVTKPE
ncbi:MAG: hypothetical protein OXQ29_25520 [Rhodospirillaceae bacterium]|nr:hypothetical protein [Rhodospirillaceae bacterium]